MTPFIPAVDTHAHVFDRSCRLVEPRRYTPAYEATVEDYLGLLDRAGVARGVLVQPSFLGTDNGYMVAALRAHPDRLRGIAVVDPDVTEAELDDMAEAGVRGIRYNLYGLDPGVVARPQVRALTRRATARGWLVEVHAPGAALPGIFATLAEDAGRIVVHHFGRPDATRPEDDAGFRALARFGPEGPVWVKLSAAYRLNGADPSAYAAALMAQFGPGRLVWGSDWPWTQHEDRVTLDTCLGGIAAWENGTGPRIDAASRALYGFDGGAG